MAAALKRLIRFLAGPDLLLWLLPALMVLVATGTIAQKYVGLYVAEKTFFSSFIIWGGGFLPLPGGYTLLGLLSLSLLLKFLLTSEWRRERIGSNLAHLSILVLLAGGLLSSLLAEDGFLTVAEGATTRQVQDYHHREIMLVENGRLLAAIDAHKVRAGQALEFPASRLRLDIVATCRNCRILPRTNPDPGWRGMAKGMALETAPLDRQDEANVGGLTFRLSGSSAETDGLYILFEDGPPLKLAAGNEQTLELIYGKQQRTLPFSVKLVDFVKTSYAGTDTAKDYYSDVIITDGALSWPARIGMNAPLRYRGYTLYQSAFTATPERETTVLAVSRDQGRFLPYLATCLLALGLLLHLALRRPVTP